MRALGSCALVRWWYHSVPRRVAPVCFASLIESLFAYVPSVRLSRVGVRRAVESRTPYYSVASTMSTDVPKTPETARSPYRTVSPLPTMADFSFRPSPAKRRRCLSFAPEKTISYIETSSEMSQEQKDAVWYRGTEMASFKQKARSLCRKRMHESTMIPRHSITADNSEGDVTLAHNSTTKNNDCHEEDSMRGMDIYLPARQKYCKKFVQHVLEAYHIRCVGNDEHVALLSEKWSKKSVKRAVATGKKDFFMAYFPEEYEYEALMNQKQRIASTIMQDRLLLEDTPLKTVVSIAA